MKRKRENSESTGQNLREGVPLRSRLRYRGPLPNFDYVNWMDDVWVEPVLPVDGFYSAPERPGHGLQFKKEFLTEYKI